MFKYRECSAVRIFLTGVPHIFSDRKGVFFFKGQRQQVIFPVLPNRFSPALVSRLHQLWDSWTQTSCRLKMPAMTQRLTDTSEQKLRRWTKAARKHLLSQWQEGRQEGRQASSWNTGRGGKKKKKIRHSEWNGLTASAESWQREARLGFLLG